MTDVAANAERTTCVGYAGEPGAFAEDAVLTYFGDAPRTGVGSFRDVFAAVAAGEVDAGVVPIENLVNGTVRENLDLLLEHDLRIVGEVVVPVRLCLAALPGERLESIERVYSHIQALGQAELFLRTRPWTLLTTYNTAGAGKLIADGRERGAAALLSPRAASLFGLEVLADGIQSVPDNRTRFLVVARPGVEPPPAARPAVGAPRTTLVFSVRNEPGALLRVLRVFAERGLNLTSLESRPTRQRAWEYDFWTDVDADLGAADAPFGGAGAADAMAALGAETTMLRVLGSYARAEGA